LCGGVRCLMVDRSASIAPGSWSCATGMEAAKHSYHFVWHHGSSRLWKLSHISIARFVVGSLAWIAAGTARPPNRVRDAGRRGTRSGRQAVVPDAGTSGQRPNACPADSRHRTSLGTTTRPTKTAHARGESLLRAPPDRRLPEWRGDGADRLPPPARINTSDSDTPSDATLMTAPSCTRTATANRPS
jgi:hypothetical protein